MDSYSSIELVLIVVLVSLSALFALCETSLTSLSKMRVKKMEDAGVKGVASVIKVQENPEKMLSTILIGGNFVAFMAVSLATSLAIHYFGDSAAVLAVSTVVITLVLVIFGEITPKTFAVNNSEAVSVRVAWFVKLVGWLFTPLIFIINMVSQGILRLFGTKPAENRDEITEHDIKAIISISHEQGMLESDEKSIFENLFATREGTAREIMTPRTDIIAVSLDDDFDHVKQLFDDEKLSRLPVYSDSVDNIVGILHLRDFIFADHKNGEFDIPAIMRKPYFTFEAKPIDELFRNMRSGRIYMAVVLDEYGGTAGIITLEDIIEKIIGYVGDEYEPDESDIQSVTENEFIVEGSARIELVNEMLGVELESSEFESIGGYVIGLMGKIPQKGDVAFSEGLKFGVEEMERNRIIELRITRN
ncbi:MAG: hemolysin family protein [Defluviitaleaceae bacterium]|nr:hemolysin family protein [Defluviitaleaceae bacterium]